MRDRNITRQPLQWAKNMPIVIIPYCNVVLHCLAHQTDANTPPLYQKNANLVKNISFRYPAKDIARHDRSEVDPGPRTGSIEIFNLFISRSASLIDQVFPEAIFLELMPNHALSVWGEASLVMSLRAQASLAIWLASLLKRPRMCHPRTVIAKCV